MRSRNSLRFVPVLAALTAGCAGAVGTDGGGSGGDGAGASIGGATGSGGSGGNGVSDPRDVFPPAPEPLAASLAACEKPLADRLMPGAARRLTRLELLNSISTAFMKPTQLLTDLPVDGKAGGFYSNDEVEVTDSDLGTYQAIAEEYSGFATQDASKTRTLVGTACWANKISIDAAPASWPAEVKAACAQDMIRTRGRNAFRRPLTQGEYDALWAMYQSQADFISGLRAVVEALLQSPKFLYRMEIGVPAPDKGAGVHALTDFEIASRISYAIWASSPDAALLDAAAAGQVHTPEQIEAHARRLIGDLRATNVLQNIYSQILHLDKAQSAAKDPMRFPNFEASKPSMLTETRMFLEESLWKLQADGKTHGAGTVESLLTARFGFINNVLAAAYGLPNPNPPNATDGFVRVNFTTQPRAGLLTQASYLAGHASNAESSIVQRGLTIRRHLLCQDLPDPPPDVVMDPTKDRLVAQPCASCHTRIDPIGTGYENFDAVGKYRTTTTAGAVNPAGLIEDLGGKDVAFTGPIELADKIVAAPEYRACQATQYLRFGAGRELTALDECDMALARKALQDAGGNVAETLVQMTKRESFRYIVKRDSLSCTQ